MTEAQPAPDENPVRVVWQLAWPAVALNSLQVVNTLLDSGFVGHLDRASLIAYGGVTSVLFMLFSLGIALGTAATAIVSRAYGAGDQPELMAGTRQSLALAWAFGLVLSIGAFATADFWARILIPANEPTAMREMTEFLRIYALGLPAIYAIQVLAGALRGVGDTKSPMVISGIQILIHIVLNVFLIFPGWQIGSLWIPGANWGLDGAAASLTGSAALSAVGYVAYLRHTKLGRGSPWVWPDLQWAQRILRIAVPAGLMAVLRVASLFAFQIILKSTPDGSAATAAIRVGFAIESIMFMPSFGLSMAAAALVGQSLGMKRPERAERLAWVAAHHAGYVTILLCAPIFLFADPLATLLLGDKPEVVAQAASLLRWLCVTELGFAYAMVMIGAMQGAGDTKRPLWITILCLWFLRVPMAGFLALAPPVLPIGLGWGALGAWVAMSVTQGIQGLMAVWFFRQGAWKNATV